MYNAIKNIYPNIDDDDFALQDNADGRGVFIARWSYTQPKPTLAQLDAVKNQSEFIPLWTRIKAERDRRSTLGGYKVGTKWFHSDSPSRIQQIGLVLAGASLPLNLQWKTMDGSFITMTPTLAVQVFQSAIANDTAIFTVAETHKAGVEASAMPSNYNFLTGWPLAFGE